LARKQKTHDWLAIVGFGNCFLALENLRFPLHDAGKPDGAPLAGDSGRALHARTNMDLLNVLHIQQCN